MTTEAEYQERLKKALLAMQKMRAKIDELESLQREAIAVIGLDCRFPGAEGPDAYWRLMHDGVDAITEIPESRWAVEDFYDPDPDAPGKMSVRWGGFLDDVDAFDATFFGISPREARGTDPQQRLVLETSWRALEHAGIVPATLAGSNTGVFIGVTVADYLQRQANHDYSQIDAYRITGNSLNGNAGRVSYFFGLNGPSMIVDTACSSSLTAIHLAVNSLRSRESDMALAGGVNLILSPETSISATKASMMATDGRCKTFDARADGFIRSEGVGIVVLKRLSDARRDGDRVLAVIRGTALNQDGASSGLTVPNKQAQEAVIRAALENAGVAPGQVSYVEAHGTGTSLGDPIEVRALTAALAEGRTAPFYLGSVKTNIGHSESAAGIAALIKVVLALQHGEIPPNLHFQTPSPHIDWSAAQAIVPTEPVVWRGAERIAGVSAFGATGTNVHAIVAAAPEVEMPAEMEDEPRSYLLPLSAQSEATLRDVADRYARFLDESAHRLDIICSSAAAGRTHFRHRLAAVAGTREGLKEGLAAFASGVEAPGVVQGAYLRADRPRIAFLYTGHGSQYMNMGRALFESEAVFHDAVLQCEAHLEKYLDVPITRVLYPQPDDEVVVGPLWDGMTYTQPAQFVLAYALTQLLASWGIRPDVTTGHSVGEYAAACAAGMISLADGLKLVCARGRLMDASPKGAMAAVFAEERLVAELIAPYKGEVSIAVLNGPTSVVISGVEKTVEELCTQFNAQGIKTRRLNVAQSSHSPLVDWFLDEFEAIAQTVSYRSPESQYVSCVSGQLASFEMVGNASYWRTHQRQPVRFADAASTLLDEGFEILLEIGPAPTLLDIIARLPGVDERDYVAVPTLRKGQDDGQQLHVALGTLYVHGVDVPWRAIAPPRMRIELPAYPFQKQRYWLDEALQQERRTPPLHPLLGWRVRSATQEWIFERDLSVTALPYLVDHRVYDNVIFPGTGYIEMALAAGNLRYGYLPAVSDLTLHEPLALSGDAPSWVQFILAEDGAFRVLSQGQDDSWLLHATGALDPAPAVLEAPSLAAQRVGFDDEMPVEDLYMALAQRGLVYGPSFRGLDGLWLNDSKDEVLARLTVPEGVSASGYHGHPALLDAALHALVKLMDDGDVAYMPFYIGAVRLQNGLSNLRWSKLAIRERAAETVTADVYLFDDDGNVGGALSGLVLKKAPAMPRFGATVDDWLYEVGWQEAAAGSEQAAGAQRSRRFLIFAGKDPVSRELASALKEVGHEAALVFPGEAFAVEQDAFNLKPGVKEDVQQLLAHVGDVDEIVYLWALDADGAAGANGAEPACRQETIIGGALALVQALAESNRAPHLWLVTQGAQPLGPVPVAVAQAPLSGFAKVTSQEYPELACTLVDLEPVHPDAGGLLDVLLSQPDEDVVALRRDARFVPRLLPWQAPSSDVAGGPVQLTSGQSETIEDLTFSPLIRRAPGTGEVEIEVVAAALGFRDVLNALGMYPGGPIPFGSECAGRITAVGEGVTQFQPGDAVVAMAFGTFQTYAYAPEAFVARKPDHLSFKAAATIPSAFLTAAYGLVTLAGLQPGEKVLIHAASGGVGMAAVQLAKHIGAEIYATAGTPEKRALLEALGVDHVFDSRSTSFAKEIRAMGVAMDVILNSLTGEFVEHSVDTLAERGRFVELGKRDIWTPEQFSAARPQAMYTVVDLAAEGSAEPTLIRSLWQEVIDLFSCGALHPLPVHEFALSDAAEAFRFMARARHTGRIVLTRPDMEDGLTVRAQGSYLITGGLGGLGLSVARWLAAQGARHLILVGRHRPSAQAQTLVDDLTEAGIQVEVVAADVARKEDMARLFQEVAASMPPLRGVVHAAGVLDDGVLGQQTWERFAHVFAPKVEGGWHLHELTKDLPLDFFVLFSSAVSLLGSAGQANHVAASAFLDALAHYRRAQGLPALSIDWGPWAEVGAAAGADISSRVKQRGVSNMSPEQGLQALGNVMAARDSLTQVGIVPVNWSTFLEKAQAPFFAEIGQTVEIGPQKEEVMEPAWVRRIREAPRSKRPSLLLAFAREKSLNVLGLGDDFPLNQHQPLQELGLDSLLAVELRNSLGRGLGLTRPLPATLVFDYPTTADLAQYLAQFFEETTEKTEEKSVVEQDLSELEMLSDEDAEALLLAELEMMRKDD